MVKKETKKETAVKKDKKPVKAERYFESTGGRKTALARVRLFAKQYNGVTVNGKDFKIYFQDKNLQREVMKPFETVNLEGKVGVIAKISGGGIHGQATALANGIAKAMVLFNAELRKGLRKAGFLTRDSRMVERKKYGLKKARRAPQWAKR